MISHATGNPEGLPGYIKFIAGTEGLRGALIAVYRDEEHGDKAIILAQNTAFNGLCGWGQFVLVHEDNPEEWPKFVETVNRIPDEKGWRIVLDDDPRILAHDTCNHTPSEKEPVMNPSDEPDDSFVSLDVQIEVMKKKAASLTRLLNDPHPGLITWCSMVNDVLTDLEKIHEGTYDYRNA